MRASLLFCVAFTLILIAAVNILHAQHLFRFSGEDVALVGGEPGLGDPRQAVESSIHSRHRVIAVSPAVIAIDSTPALTPCPVGGAATVEPERSVPCPKMECPQSKCDECEACPRCKEWPKPLPTPLAPQPQAVATSRGACCGTGCKGIGTACCHDDADMPFYEERHRGLRKWTSKNVHSYIVINEARSGSSWFQEMSVLHPGVKVQFELDITLAPYALDCQQCFRQGQDGLGTPEIGRNSKHEESLPPKMHPPLACGMTIIGHNNNFARVKSYANEHDASMIIILRRNHLATGLSSYKHFVEGHKSNAMQNREFWTDVRWRASLEASTKDYEKLWHFPLRARRPAFIIFYEEMFKHPEILWKNVQKFLKLPHYDIEGISKIHKQVSSGDPMDYMNQRQLARMRQAPNFQQWRSELTNGHFFQKLEDWKGEFTRICREYKKNDHAMVPIYWRDFKCTNGVVERNDWAGY